MYPPETMLLDLHPLPLSALKNDQLSEYYAKFSYFKYFNPIQTHFFMLHIIQI